jgi:hypothetical protein
MGFNSAFKGLISLPPYLTIFYMLYLFTVRPIYKFVFPSLNFVFFQPSAKSFHDLPESILLFQVKKVSK